MPSTKWIILATVCGLGCVVAPGTWAASRQDACVALTDARVALYSMINAKGKAELDSLSAKVKGASARLDSVLAAMSGADAKAAADFKLVWDQFKSTRDNDIIPALYKGSVNDAKKLADGIQLDRLSNMWAIMSCK